MNRRSFLLSASGLAAGLAAPRLARADAPGVNATSIKIGHTCPYSGPASAYGAIGHNIFSSQYSIDIDIHPGAGAYICGEETGMITSLEGYKGQPKLKLRPKPHGHPHPQPPPQPP